jgi:hypothetical protein
MLVEGFGGAACDGGGFGDGGLGHEDDELVAAVSRGDIGRSDGLGDGACGLLEAGVALAVAELVVEGFEAVEVEHGAGEVGFVADGLGEHAVESRGELSAVGEAGERVGPGLAFEGCDALGEVRGAGFGGGDGGGGAGVAPAADAGDGERFFDGFSGAGAVEGGVVGGVVGARFDGGGGPSGRRLGVGRRGDREDGAVEAGVACGSDEVRVGGSATRSAAEAERFAGSMGRWSKAPASASVALRSAWWASPVRRSSARIAG